MAKRRKPGFEAGMDKEIRFHLEQAVKDFIASGMNRKEARFRALREFGAVALAKEEIRDTRRLTWLADLTQDVHYALRGLRRSPGFALTSIATLTLAIGLNVAGFTVMNTVLFRGAPLVQGNDRLVYMQERAPSGRGGISYTDFEDWRSQAQAFEGMAYVASGSINFSDGDGRSIDLFPATVSTNTFELLGVPPMLGRDFVPTDAVPGAAPVAILNYRFWESWFGKRSDIVGLTVNVGYFNRALGTSTNKVPGTIVGVMPEGFDFGEKEDLWMPLAHTPELHQRGFTPGGWFAFGRLRDGTDLEEARTELGIINRRLEAAYPATNRGVVPQVNTHSQAFVGPDAPMIYGSLWAAVWFIFLIACANLANLTLARTIGRWREFSTRMVLGAGRGRMIRQIIVESLMIASIAGALGYWIAKWGVHTFAVATASIYQILDYTVDSGTLAYAAAISVAAAVLFSLAPIGNVWRLGSNSALRGDARGATRDPRSKRSAAVLVAVQMALAIVLLSGAGVLVRSLSNIVNAETGVQDPENILVGSMRLPSDKYPSHEARLVYFDRLEAQLKSTPGIEYGSASSILPLDGRGSRLFEIDGRPSPPEGGETAQILAVGSDYFPVVGASLISGREFNDRDHAEALPIAIVNQSFAAQFWPDEQPLGKRLRVEDEEWRTVVGVVPNIMQGDGTRQNFRSLIYVPFGQEPLTPAGASFLARTSVPPNQVAQAVRAEVQKLDPDLILENFSTLKATFGFDRDRSMPLEIAELGKHAVMAPVFAVIALLLATIGLYAAIAHSVSQRTKEIGLRMAIGATAEDIRRMALREGMFPVAIGLIIGLGASLAVNRILQSQLVGVSPYDPVTMAGAPIVLILVALLASYLPARRAASLDPMVALRHD